jgi:hypothetical protein
MSEAGQEIGRRGAIGSPREGRRSAGFAPSIRERATSPLREARAPEHEADA